MFLHPLDLEYHGKYHQEALLADRGPRPGRTVVTRLAPVWRGACRQTGLALIWAGERLAGRQPAELRGALPAINGHPSS